MATVALDPPVIVVDDDAPSVELIGRYLGRLRLVNPILSFTDGAAAAGYLGSAADGNAPLPVLALVDLHMPGVDGFALLRIVRQRSLEGRFPVVLLTGSTELADLEEAYALGVSAYLIKPVAYDALGHVVRNLDVPWALSSA